ncbi:hypothetical protein HY640_00060 [Candidatus Woesearchaeota archaeon]|nr:hypothetical protein [Candidatus Woesearchaeota archaeon]
MTEEQVAYVVMAHEKGTINYVLFPESAPGFGITGILPTVPDAFLATMRIALAMYKIYGKIKIGGEFNPEVVKRIESSLNQAPEAPQAAGAGPIARYSTLEELASGILKLGDDKKISGITTRMLPDYLPDISLKKGGVVRYSVLPEEHKSELDRLLTEG